MKMSDKKFKVVIATHKKYKMPSDTMYIPLHVGAEGKKDEKGNILDLGYQKDNIGENISELNANFCELTGLYWAWKNLNYDYIGLVHYRRYFTLKSPFYLYKYKNEKINCVLNSQEAAKLVNQYDVIVPKKRKYYIESLYTHYSHTHDKMHLDKTREIIAKQYPEYIMYYDTAVKRKSGYMFNMFIMKKSLLNDYCKWLFNILFELRKEIDSDNMSQFDARFYGRVSEIIFNCWLLYKVESEKIKIKEIPYMYLGKVDWKRKVSSFLKAKFLHRKYDKSF